MVPYCLLFISYIELFVVCIVELMKKLSCLASKTTSVTEDERMKVKVCNLHR